MRYPNNAQAVKLRVAAVAFTNHIPDDSDDRDRKGVRLNRRLLEAAVRYAQAVEGQRLDVKKTGGT